MRPSTVVFLNGSHAGCSEHPSHVCQLPSSLSQLDVGDLKQQLAHSQTLFPENPSVWFKDLAGYLNLHLVAPDTGPTLSNHPHGGSAGGSYCAGFMRRRPSVGADFLLPACLQTTRTA